MDQQGAAHWRVPSQGSFNGARNVVLHYPTFMDVNYTNDKDDLLARHTIPGAEFDSSERYPPPSCHPGTRLDISGKIVSWMRDHTRAHKLVWLHGPAGVGKSAVIQTLAESESDSRTSILGATIFFSRPAERDDPQRVVITIAYQLAVKYQLYRRYVVELLMLDPRLVKKSLVEQFKRLIVKPFIERRLLEGETILITLDGLDECKGESAQREIIFLISKLSLQHPHTPLIWIIASRTEPHISSAFSRQDVEMSYLGVDMPVDSDQACSDVESFLRDKFTEIRENYSTSFPPSTQQWPAETQFTKVASRASGLFAFAGTVVRFVEDGEYSNPIAQLQKVIDVLDSHSEPGIQENPFAALDMLYTQIMSEIPSRVLSIARKLLISSAWGFAFTCNILAINQVDAYSALRKLHSVLKIPPPEQAHSTYLEVFHTSFTDYLNSPSRSGSFWIDSSETERLWVASDIRVLSEAHNIRESTVHTSSINISFQLESVETVQKQLFYLALSHVLDALPERLEHFDELGNFFQDIDYANIGALLPTPLYAFSVLANFLAPDLSPLLRELGIITTIPIRSLDLGSVGSNGVAYVASDKLEPLSSRGDLNWGLDRRTFWLGGFFESSRTSLSDDWGMKVVALGDEPGWTAHIHQHLTDIMGLLPSHPVKLLGKGHKTCAVIAVDILDRLWLYILPYKQS